MGIIKVLSFGLCKPKKNPIYLRLSTTLNHHNLTTEKMVTFASMLECHELLEMLDQSKMYQTLPAPISRFACKLIDTFVHQPTVLYQERGYVIYKFHQLSYEARTYLIMRYAMNLTFEDMMSILNMQGKKFLHLVKTTENSLQQMFTV